MSNPWRGNTPAGVWSTLGPYFCMMPLDFVHRTVEQFCPAGGAVIDPFMGRGSTNFAARATGRSSLGCDRSPLAWVYASTKCDPEPDPLRLLDRLADLESDVRAEDAEAETEFQSWAWSPRVLAFLRSARRNLGWQNDRTDRTLMALILVYLHGKLGYSLGNQMGGSRATAPEYSCRWWADRGMTPPTLDPIDYMTGRIARWYEYGIPSGPPADIRLGLAEEVLPDPTGDTRRFDLLLTSPPYLGVTNYRQDNWIRLWLLGDDPLPHPSDTTQKYGDKPAYVAMLRGVFERSAGLLKPDATVYVRTDSRPWTRDVTAALLTEIWPSRPMLWRAEIPERSQTTRLNAKPSPMPGETDFLISNDAESTDGFEPVPQSAIDTGADAISKV